MTWKRVVQQPDDPSRRVCTACRVEKDIVNADGTRNFRPAKSGSQNEHTYRGVVMPCIECDLPRQRASAARRRADVDLRERDNARRRGSAISREVRDRINALARAQYHADRESRVAKRRADYRADPERILGPQREKYATDPAYRAAIAEYGRRQRSTPEGREAHRAEGRRWKATPRGRWLSRMHAHVRRARIASTVCDLTTAQCETLVAAYDCRCAYCNRPLSRDGKLRDDRLEVDHMNPIALGGAHTLSNVVPACGWCNGQGGKGHLPFEAGMRRLAERLGVSRIDFLRRRGLALFRMRTGYAAAA